MALSVASEFGLWPETDTDASSSSIGVVSGIPANAETAATNAWFTHPTLAVVVIVGVTAALLHSAAKPAGAKASAHLGPAEGSIEGSV